MTRRFVRWVFIKSLFFYILFVASFIRFWEWIGERLRREKLSSARSNICIGIFFMQQWHHHRFLSSNIQMNEFYLFDILFFILQQIHRWFGCLTTWPMWKIESERQSGIRNISNWITVRKFIHLILAYFFFLSLVYFCQWIIDCANR